MTGRLSRPSGVATGMIALAALALATALLLGGSAPFGRLALGLGLEPLAARLLDDPLWRGAVLYRQARFEDAAEAFRMVGPRASFNRGNALARAGRYREALAAYDAVLFRDPGDAAARANRALVAPLVAAHRGEARSGGRIDAAGGGAGAPLAEGGPKPLTQEQLHEMVTPSFTAQGVIASRQWLTTLPDEPGRYLKRRLAAAQALRRARSPGSPEEASPW